MRKINCEEIYEYQHINLKLSDIFFSGYFQVQKEMTYVGLENGE